MVVQFNMLYVDSPVGTGFSYVSSPAGYSKDETHVASDLHCFLVSLLQQLPQYASSALFLAGQSYGGYASFAECRALR
jgi:carboxypeptidase C (cathepsin A)